MRRTQFAGTGNSNPADEGRMPIRELITCDLKRAYDPDDIALAERRVAMFNHAPMLLAAGHLIWGATMLAQCVCDNFLSEMLIPMLLLALVLGVDGALAFLIRIRTNLQPHIVTRAICGTLAASGMLWLLFVNVAHASQGMPSDHVTNQAIGVGLVVTAMVAIQSPVASITNALVAIGASLVSARCRPRSRPSLPIRRSGKGSIRPSR